METPLGAAPVPSRNRPSSARRQPPADASKDPREVAAMFGSISRSYDLLNRLLSGGWDVRWRSRAVARVAEARPQRVLDVGTGTGDLALALLARPDFDGAVVGVDFTRPMLERARAKADRGGRFVSIQGDALSLPFRDETFDAVMAAFAVRNFADLARGLTECGRVLCPGGRLVILEFFKPEHLAWPLRVYLRSVLPVIGGLVSRHPTAYAYLRDSQEGFVTLAAAERLLAEAGFERVGIERLTPGFAHLVTYRRAARSSD